jgi:CrcB protein
MITFKNFLMVGLGGFLGSIARYGVSYLLAHYASPIPWPTFIVNILGSLLIGILIGFQNRMDSIISLLLITGFCGGFTTFSTFSLENLDLLREGMYVKGVGYMLSSLVLGIISVYIGIILTQKL